MSGVKIIITAITMGLRIMEILGFLRRVLLGFFGAGPGITTRAAADQLGDRATIHHTGISCSVFV